MIWRAQQPNGVDCTMGTLIDAVLVERVTLIHIDVCGEESHVLYGADAIIKRDRPLLTMEIWNDARRQEYGCSVRQDQVFAVLERLGYYWELIDGSTYLCIPSEMDEHEEVMSFNHKPTPSALQPVHKMLRS
jgi:hypothetical protein